MTIFVLSNKIVNPDLNQYIDSKADTKAEKVVRLSTRPQSTTSLKAQPQSNTHSDLGGNDQSHEVTYNLDLYVDLFDASYMPPFTTSDPTTFADSSTHIGAAQSVSSQSNQIKTQRKNPSICHWRGSC